MSKDKHQLSVKVNGTASSFSSNTALAASVVSNKTRNIDVSSYMKAFRCKYPDDYTSDDSAFGPNDEVYACVMSKSEFLFVAIPLVTLSTFFNLPFMTCL